MKDAHLITLFGGKVRLPENYFAKNKVDHPSDQEAARAIPYRPIRSKTFATSTT